MILRCILEIIFFIFQLKMTGFISVNRIRFFWKVAEENNKKMIEGFKNFQTIGGNKNGFIKR